LQRQLQCVASPNNWQSAKVGTTDGAGALSVNLISTLIPAAEQATASITPLTISFTDGTHTWTDTLGTGVLTGTLGATGTINYASGALVLAGGSLTTNVTGTFSYYPGLPVMGLEDYVKVSSFSYDVSDNYPYLLAFDTTYAYQVYQSASSINFYSVSYYKSSNNPVIWSGQDYQQFWTCNYSGAFWATNNKPGFSFQAVNTVVVGNPTTITTAAPHGLVTGDYVYFSEMTGANASDLNLQAFSITKVDGTTFTVAVNTTAHAINNAGIFQKLTAGTSSQDGIRWYDGDPTTHTGLPTTTSVGWVNFAPPLTAATVSINNTEAKKWYLVGAKAIVPFKDRLLFFSPWIQASTGAAIVLQDTVIWSWNGTPYYNALVPSGETFDVRAYYVDQTGLGGYLSAGIQNPIQTVSSNEDVLLVGFGGDGRKTRFAYTGNDLQPFLFYNINNELPSSSTFSAITMDKGAIDIGQYGIAMTDQQSSQRIDLQIPDAVFQIQALNNGADRVNAIRDWQREWIYFSYPIYDSPWKFPTRTFLFNYRDNTWAILYENFTKHGYYRSQLARSWNTIGFESWNAWREPWNSGTSSPQYPSTVAGTPQGYVLIIGQGTSETPSGQIQSFSNSSGSMRINSVNHCVNVGDYLYITSCLGFTSLNTTIVRVNSVGPPSSYTTNSFVVDVAYDAGSSAYTGQGQFTRLCQPILQTKQFNPYWDQGKQVRLSIQKLLMDTTSSSQVTMNIYLSQNPDNPWNNPLQQGGPPNSLVYSQIMYTCPEGTNLGLTPANTNLQMPTASTQQQIWHRVNTALQGDTVQIGITLSNDQMFNLVYATSEIALHAIQLMVSPSNLLS